MLVRFAKNQAGATSIEYALIASLVSVAIIVAATQLGSTLNSMFQAIVADF